MSIKVMTKKNLSIIVALSIALAFVINISCTNDTTEMTMEEFLSLSLSFQTNQNLADEVINAAAVLLEGEAKSNQIYKRFVLTSRALAYSAKNAPDLLIAARTDLLEAIDMLPNDPVNATLYYWLSQVAIKQHDFSSASSFAFASADFLEDEQKRRFMHELAVQYDLTAKAVLSVTLWGAFLDSGPDFGAGFEGERILVKGDAIRIIQDNHSMEIFFPIFTSKLDGTDNTQYGILCSLNSDNAEQISSFKQGDILIVSAIFEKKDDSKIYLRDGEIICNISRTSQQATPLEGEVSIPMEF